MTSATSKLYVPGLVLNRNFQNALVRNVQKGHYEVFQNNEAVGEGGKTGVGMSTHAHYVDPLTSPLPAANARMRPKWRFRTSSASRTRRGRVNL